MNNNGRQTHAHRTPESVSPHTAQRTGQTRAPQRKNSANTSGRSSGDYVFRAGDARHQNTALRAQQRITALTPEEKKKIQKRERREVEEREREKKWQNEVVRVRGRIDVFMLVIILVLLALGSITVFSASYPLAVSEGKASNYYIIKQLQFVGIGGFLMLLEIFLVPVDFYKNKAIVFAAYFVSMALLIYTFFRGNAQGEAVRWVRIGPINVQPSELMKVSLVLMLAWYADKYQRQMKELNLGGTSYLYNIGFPVLILGGAAGFVLIGKHLSGTIIIGAIAFFMMIIAGCKITWLLETLIPVGAAGIGLFLLKNPYALKRITTFTDENADTLDELYQTTQSLYAIGSGGLFGVGLGNSRQKYSYLTQAHTDFIFSIWCEEWGFIGAAGLIILFILFVWRGYVIAMRAPDKFTMLTAFGITTHVGLQAFLNMCVASDLIMNTGITLPFFSYGGSSLVVLMMEMGILLSISRQYYRKKSDIEREQMMKQLGMD